MRPLQLAECVYGFIRRPSFFGVVAEAGDGRIVGFNFISERDPIRPVGPIVIDPAAQGHGIGRKLMEAVLERARSARGVRLVQDTFNVQSLSLYAAPRLRRAGNSCRALGRTAERAAVALGDTAS